jgi:pyruvate formate lyase activating enzyme
MGDGLLAGCALHFAAFHPDYKMLDVPKTPARTLTMARNIALRAGLHYVYTGNVHDEAGQSTYCPGCGTRLMGRDWYEITAWHLSAGGQCESCGTAIPGVFEDRPGRWAQRRTPLRIDVAGARRGMNAT